MPIGPAIRNGMRQPQEQQVVVGQQRGHQGDQPAPPMYPASVPNSSQLPKKPRRLSGAYSAMKVEAPPYSPPVEKPCTRRASEQQERARRRRSRRSDGIRPMAKVPAAIMIMVRASTFLPADAVAERAEDHAAERADEEGRGEGAEGGQQLGGGVARGEEDLADGDRDVAVDTEVEPFHGVAERGRLHGALDQRRVGDRRGAERRGRMPVPHRSCGGPAGPGATG